MVTDAAVWDELYRLFGVGDFVEGDWARFRITEIAKVKATRTKRGVDPFELVITARWCRSHGVWVTAHWQLYDHIRAAMRDYGKRAQEEKVADLEAQIRKALAIESTVPDSPWVDRLIRASGSARAEVYAEWATLSGSR